LDTARTAEATLSGTAFETAKRSQKLDRQNSTPRPPNQHTHAPKQHTHVTPKSTYLQTKPDIQATKQHQDHQRQAHQVKLQAVVDQYSLNFDTCLTPSNAALTAFFQF
jgi:hypothetical protein